MAGKYTFKKSLKITMLTLKYVGVNLDKVHHRNFMEFIKHTWLYCFTTLWIQSAVVAEICWCYQTGIGTTQALEVVTFLAPCMTYGILGTIKTASFLFYGTITRQILNDLENMFPSNEMNEEMDNEEKKIINESMSLLGNVVYFLFYVDLALVLGFSARPLWVLAYKFLIYGEIDLTLPLDMSFPFDPLQWHVWPFMYVYQLFAALIAAANLIGADTMFFVCCTHIYMHFRILRLQLERLGTGIEMEGEVQRKFVELVKCHQRLIRLVEMLEHIFSKSNFSNYVASSALICLTGFNITTLHDKYTAVVFLVFLSSTVAQIFLICLFGEMVMDSSSKISNGLYQCKWYKVSTRTRKDIAFVLLRSQKPCKLTAMQYADVNLNTFTTILRRAWSYFALLNTLSSTSGGQY